MQFLNNGSFKEHHWLVCSGRLFFLQAAKITGKAQQEEPGC
jgi:hypothetical protein